MDTRIKKLKALGFVETRVGMTDGRHSFLWYQVDSDEMSEQQFNEYIQYMKLQNNLVAHLRNADTNRTGFSYNINTGQSNPEHGYMVSIVGHEETAPQGCDLLAFGRSYTIKHADKIAENPYLFIGCWWNGSSFVFDLSEHVDNRDVAITMGEIYNQEAIWDCESGSEYRLMREGDAI